MTFIFSLFLGLKNRFSSQSIRLGLEAQAELGKIPRQVFAEATAQPDPSFSLNSVRLGLAKGPNKITVCRVCYASKHLIGQLLCGQKK